MEYTIFDWILEIPQAIAKFGDWLISPINSQFIPISPLELLGIAGAGVLITIIGVHVVRLFTI